MATARELLEQADALMRRNRPRDEGEDTGSGIPLLTEAVGAAGRSDLAVVAGAGTNGKSAGGANGVAMVASPPSAARPAGNDPAVSDFDDIPLLTDAVPDLDPISVVGAQDGGEPSQWPEFAVREPRLDPWTVGGPSAPAAAATAVGIGHVATTAPAAEVFGIGDVATTAPAFDAPRIDLAAAATSAPANDGAAEFAPAPQEVFTLVPDAELAAMQAPSAATDTATGGDAARWVALAEDVRMQVLQRIDIFTDTGLQEQLTARLQPIVDRASADLVATINQQVGQLLRAYVAEAIEREIDKWKQDGA